MRVLTFIDELLGNIFRQRRGLDDPGWGENPSELVSELMSWDWPQWETVSTFAAQCLAVALVFWLLVRWIEGKLLPETEKQKMYRQYLAEENGEDVR